MENKTVKKIKFWHILLAVIVLMTGMFIITDTRPVVFISGKAYFGLSTKVQFRNVYFSEEDFNSLKHMRNVKQAVFIVDKLDLTILKRMNRLKDLTIGFRVDYYIEDWTTLSNCKKLEIFVGLNLKMTDLSTFKDMSNLKILYIESMGAANLKTSIINDISDVKSLTKLERFSVSGKNIIDISSLNSLVELKELSLFGTTCNDYSVLLELPNLKSLDIDKGVLTENEIKTLEEKGISVYEYEYSENG